MKIKRINESFTVLKVFGITFLIMFALMSSVFIYELISGWEKADIFMRFQNQFILLAMVTISYLVGAVVPSKGEKFSYNIYKLPIKMVYIGVVILVSIFTYLLLQSLEGKEASFLYSTLAITILSGIATYLILLEPPRKKESDELLEEKKVS